MKWILSIALLAALGIPTDTSIWVGTARAVERHATPSPPAPLPQRGDGRTYRDKVTFDRDIAPILYKYCAACHRPGEPGPFSLLTYEDARHHAQQMVAVTGTRFMPPWLPEPGYGDFIGELRLTPRQIEIFKRWVEEGEPAGDPRDLPPAPHFIPGWQLGKPDLVLRMGQPYHLRASGWDVYRNFILSVPITKPHYVKAIEIRPGNTRILHHCNILVDPDRSLRRLNEIDGQPGFPGMDFRVESEAFAPSSQFLFWKPGAPPYVEPAGMSWELNPGTDLILNAHMQPTGKPETLQASVGIYFTDQPPTKFPMLLELEHDSKLDIPPGDKDFVITDQFTLPMDVYAYGVYPHAHYLGKDLKGWATLPDGKRKWLIWIPHWNLYWQGVYRYVKPVFLPRGAVLHMQYTYDNSADNPLNPNNPPKWVRSGNRASDEMGHLWIQVLPRTPKIAGIDSRIVLQEAMMRHWLAKYPDDFVAHFNLGSVFQDEGKMSRALAQYQVALRARPRSATAENSLGSVLESEGKLAEAIVRYRRAISARPAYADAHYNLGVCLLAQGDDEGARNEFQQVLRLQPDDSRVRQHLTEALRQLAAKDYAQGLVTRAVRNLREAVQLDPMDPDSCINLGTVLARQGDLVEAEVYFKRALQIAPGNTVAQRNLDLARSLLSKRQAR
jgi:Tfp pilus assembly protein PilF